MEFNAKDKDSIFSSPNRRKDILQEFQVGFLEGTGPVSKCSGHRFQK
jgi:hypothetical protein